MRIRWSLVLTLLIVLALLGAGLALWPSATAILVVVILLATTVHELRHPPNFIDGGRDSDFDERK